MTTRKKTIKKSSLIDGQGADLFKKEISRYIEKTSFLLGKPLKEGQDFNIDIPDEKRSFKSYCKEYGDLNGAVYIFYLDSRIQFDKNRFFKIGCVGSNSTARFDSQHYSLKGNGSCLANSILNNSVFKVDKENIGDFVKNNFVRINILFLKSAPKFSNKLVESLLHYKYNPIFEGPKSQQKE